MQIQIISTDKVKVTIDGKEAPYVNACICLTPTEDGQSIKSNIMPFMNDVKVSSNVESISSAIANDPNVELEVLESDAYLAMTNKIVSLGYRYK